MQLFLLVWAQIFHRYMYTKTIILIFEKCFRKFYAFKSRAKVERLDENFSFLRRFKTGSINVVVFCFVLIVV